ncbi:MAG: 16S rRNA (cytosine(1402)-N(4))-methyltransferase RsmH [Bacteroidales bacterium]|nr:16S rRNA (cytosine(1402)-N(4))-methyltransferase RsmH [Bacteroidales bacterium]
MYHNPVLLNECIDGLAIDPKGIYVDVTFGGGGHSLQILNKLTSGKLYAFDQDEDATGNIIEDDRFVFIRQNFRYLINFLKLHNAVPVNGILADLGVSSYQIDNAERGFSTRFSGVMDMRMNKNLGVTATTVLNEYSEDKLISIFSGYGEIRNSKKLASTIVNKRKINNISSIDEFKKVITNCVHKGKENKYYARVFQALRIEVNDELGALKDLLEQSVKALKGGGRMVVISYHSLEDRLVKNFFKSGNFKGNIEKDFYGNPIVPFKIISRKPLIPGEEEISTNSRARSARLRIAEKVNV